MTSAAFYIALPALGVLVALTSLVALRARRPRSAGRLATPARRAPIFAPAHTVGRSPIGDIRGLPAKLLTGRALETVVYFAVVTALVVGLGSGVARLLAADDPLRANQQPTNSQRHTWFELDKPSPEHQAYPR